MLRAFSATRGYPNPSSALNEPWQRLRRAWAEGGVALIIAPHGAAVGSLRFAVPSKLRSRLRRSVGGEHFERVADAPLELSRLAVAPEHQGRGLGGDAVTWLEALGRRLGATAIHADARSQQPDNRPFYLRRGYRVVGYSERYGIPDIRTHLIKELDAP